MNRKLLGTIAASTVAVFVILAPAAANAAVTWTPATVDFGESELSQVSRVRFVKVTATCAQFNITCVKPGRFTPEPSFTGDTADFSQVNDCGAGISGNSKATGTCLFALEFNPEQLGSRTTEFTLGYNTTEVNIKTPVIVQLSGVGIPRFVPAKTCKKKSKKRSASAAKKKKKCGKHKKKKQKGRTQ